MNFRLPLLAAFTYLGALLVATAPCSAAAPNIVFILADDIGYEGLGCYGSADYQTPVLDQLAAEGIRFNNAHAHPLCTPSRVLAMTGRYGHRNYTGFGILNKEEITFGHLFRQAGYKTCIAGKWQLGKDRNLLDHFGFDEYMLWWLETRSDRYNNVGELISNGEVLPGGEGKYGPDVVNDFVLDFITRNQQEPFFCYYPMILVHDPFEPTPDSDEGADGADDTEQNFADMVQYMDKLVGKLVTHLEELGLRENTLIIFAGDNGTHGSITSRLNNGVEIKGGKGRLNDAGTHVPLIVNGTGVVDPGREVDALVDFSDFLPTVCEAASIDLPSDRHYDGISFLPAVKNEEAEKREWAFFFYTGRYDNPPKICIRDEKYQLFYDQRLFDLADDPKMKTPLEDLSSEAAAAKEQLSVAMKEVLGDYEKPKKKKGKKKGMNKGKKGGKKKSQKT